MTSMKMEYCVYPCCMYSNAFSFNVPKLIAKGRFKKSCVILNCASRNERCRASTMECAMRNKEGLLCTEHEASREHCIAEDCKQEENAIGYIYHWDRVYIGTIWYWEREPLKTNCCPSACRRLWVA